MNKSIGSAELNLHFCCHARDGMIKGRAKMIAYIHGDAIRIGERILPSSGNSEFNMIAEDYDVRIKDISRIVGKECWYVCECQVTNSTALFWTGEPYDYIVKSMEEIIRDWEILKATEWWRPWDPDKQIGTKIDEMKLVKHPNKKPCVFCTDPKIKKRMIKDNADTWAFPTNIPITPGHILIAPKRCVSRIRDLTNSEWCGIKDLADRLMPALRIAYGAEGFNMCWNEGIMGGQRVPHFHFHIIPRKNGDTGLLGYDPRSFLYRTGDREPLPEKELLEIRDEIQRAL
ncbi:MAG: HIT family protein [Patescibacteria group bacterium]|nr:HIT family protein [Patescibacteria group bacterium]MDE1966970.1 HIT family protein [Patescibacteria group bacterium]